MKSAGRFALAVAMLLSPQAHAEGARVYMSCQITSSCDAMGGCAPTRLPFAFELEPVDVGPDGTGQYRILVGGGASDAEAARDSTLTWTGPQGIWNQLVFAREPYAIWITRAGGQSRLTLVRFLTCEEVL